MVESRHNSSNGNIANYPKAMKPRQSFDDILPPPPHWLTRSGAYIVVLTMVLLFLLMYLIEYPTVISAGITITSKSPPAQVVARASGKIIKLFVNENDFVRPGDNLAMIENPASFTDMLALQGLLKSIGDTIDHASGRIAVVKLPGGFNLGELQNPYSALVTRIKKYKMFIETGKTTREIQYLRAQVKLNLMIQKNLQERRNLLERLNVSAQRQYDRDKSLYEKMLFAEVDLEKSESSLLQTLLSTNSVEREITNSTERMTSFEKTIQDLQYQFREDSLRYLLEIQEALDDLKSQVRAWEQRYVLKAPIAGHVSFVDFWSENRYVHDNEQLFKIVPPYGEVIGEARLPAVGAGGVRIGQSVNIKLDSFPYKEFGIVKGVVDNISITLHDKTYLLEVGLPNGPTTSYNRKLELKEGMTGTAEITTEDLSLLERLFSQLRYLLSHKR